MNLSEVKNYINHYVENIKLATNLSGYRLNIILNELVDNTSTLLTNFNLLSASLGTVPLKYKALISQDAPVATTTSPTVRAGQIWTLEAYNAADAATIAALEKISGTLYAVGSKYRSATFQTLALNAATTLSYNGAPYLVSKDVNGKFNPFVNTLGTVTFTFINTGRYRIECIGAFASGKVSRIIGISDIFAQIGLWEYDVDKLELSSRNNNGTNGGGTYADSLIANLPIEIEINP